MADKVDDLLGYPARDRRKIAQRGRIKASGYRTAVPVPKKEANNLLQSRSMLVYNICMLMLKPNQNLPLAEWEDGSIRVTDSRVPLDAIVYEFKLGANR
jgi:hypothetical protein